MHELAHRQLLSIESEVDDGQVMKFIHGLEVFLNLRYISASPSKEMVLFSISKKS